MSEEEICKKRYVYHKRTVEAYGHEKTIAEWAECSGISYVMLYNRIMQLKWEPETALSTPMRGPGCHASFWAKRMEFLETFCRKVEKVR